MDARHTWILAVVVPTAAIVSEGCRPTEPPPGTTTGPVTLPPVGEPDPWVTTQVQARFFTEPEVRASDVAVSTEDGVVTLTGTVAHEGARTAAARIAQQIEGVSRVDNRLVVQARAPAAHTTIPRPAAAADQSPASMPERFDAAWTTTKIQAQYFADPVVKGRNIEVTADAEGTVTLRGQIDSEAARGKAVEIAKRTAGVRNVVDELRVRTAARAAETTTAARIVQDGWITAQIQSKFFLDPDVKGRDIDVDTKQGVVTLTGHVATPAERRQAVDIVRNTDGVREVKDQLSLRAVTALAGAPGGVDAAVESWTDPASSMRPPDSWITTTIQAKFFRSEQVGDQPISVATNGGVVTLRGEVDTQAALSTAAEIALGTKGVRQVVNELKVGTPAS